MTAVEVETHRTHCCVLHGCKYSQRNCPVKRKKVVQEDRCEDCHSEGLKVIPDPTDSNWDLLLMGERKLREELIKARATINDLRDKRLSGGGGGRQTPERL